MSTTTMREGGNNSISRSSIRRSPAIERSQHETRPIIFNFSDVPVTVKPESDPELVRCDMQRAWEELHSRS